MNGPRLEGERLVLRPIESKDNRRIREWRNAPGVHHNLFTEEETTPERQDIWYRTYLLDPAQVRFVIETKALGPLGCCGFTDKREGESSANLSIFVGEPAARGKGLAREALDLLLDYGFNQWELARVIAEMFADNEPARRLYERVGFQELGPGEPRRGRDVTLMQLDKSAWSES